MKKSRPSEASDLIERLARVMRAGEHFSGLNPAQWEALRYLARCNRFSNSPAALTEYVSATRGTVSQTLNALERKGLIRKEPRVGDKRSVALVLTQAGRKTLSWDPWQRIGLHEHDLEAGAHDGLVEGLKLLLDKEFARNGLKRFGSCRECRFFQAGSGGAGAQRCSKKRESLSDGETGQICASYEGRAAA